MATEKQDHLTKEELHDTTARKEAVRRAVLVANASGAKAEALQQEDKLLTDDLRLKYDLKSGDKITDSGAIVRKAAVPASDDTAGSSA